MCVCVDFAMCGRFGNMCTCLYCVFCIVSFIFITSLFVLSVLM